MPAERIGIMGGTFNPIHAGHIAMAKAAAQSAQLDRVLMIPTGNPPHKTGITPAEDRWRMVCAAVAQEPQLEPCRMELERQGVIYTVDTLSELHRIYPQAELFYIIGADTLMELKNWRRYETVITLCTFLLCPRTGAASEEAMAAERERLTAMGGSFMDVVMEPVDVSSTVIREALQDGTPTTLLPAMCQEYAHAAGLYGLEKRVPDGEILLDRLWQVLSRKRFAHTLAVAYTARLLAQHHGLDAERAELAGLLHDCAKCLPEESMRTLCIEQHLTDDPAILASGNLMHSLAGAWVAQHEYGIADEAVLNAVACHTMGRPGMTPFDMVIFIADKIEPTRRPFPSLTAMRNAAGHSLAEAMIASMEGTAQYVAKRGEPMHPLTADTLAWLKSLPINQ